MAFTAEYKDQQIAQVFIQKGKPTQKGYIKHFNGFFSNEVLDIFLSPNNGRYRSMQIAN